MLDRAQQTLRQAVRQLTASRAFTVATILTLALGIGATTMMFGIERTLTDVMLDVAQPSTLVHLGQAVEGQCAACGQLAAGNVSEMQQGSHTLSRFAFSTPWKAILRLDDRSEVLAGARVTSGFFETLGVRALLGRTFTAADSIAGHTNVVMLGETLWRARFGGDSSIVGRDLIIDGAPTVVLGIIPRGSALPELASVWAPLAIDPANMANHSTPDGDAFARLAPGVTLSGAEAELHTLGPRIASRYPTELRGISFGVETFSDWLTPSRADDIPLFVVVYLVLAVACINLAGLLLARLTARRKEIAVRAALGASRRAIIRQLLSETTLLTFAAGVVGAGIAAEGIRLFRDRMPAVVAEAVPRWHELHLDGQALAAALITSVLTGLLVGLWPALRFTRAGLFDDLKADSRGASSGAAVSRLRRMLVVTEIALAVTLLGASGLLVRSVANQRLAHDGFRSDQSLTFRVAAPRPADAAYWTRLARTLAALPGVRGVSMALGLPYGAAVTQPLAVAGRAAVLPGHEPVARIVVAADDYFATLGIRLVSGRAFDASDGAGAPRVAIIDERLARNLFGSSNPIGERLVIGTASWRVAGVAAETRPNARRPIGATTAGEVYLPLSQRPSSALQFVLRTRGDALASAHDAERAVHDFDAGLAVTEVQPFGALIENAMAPYRILAIAIASFAAAAAIIALIGLYGIISFVVAQRMREFGIRRALGADGRRLFGLTLAESLQLMAIGSAFGLLGAVGAGRIMRVVLVNVSAADPVTLAGVVVAMAIVTLVATYGPARSAARADPMVALRGE